MNTSTKCSKAKGQYCRIHNPAPATASIPQQVEDSKRKIDELLKPKFDVTKELETLNAELKVLSGGVINVESVSSSTDFDVYDVTFSAEHDLVLFVAYPKDGSEPLRAVDYGFFENKDYSSKKLSFEKAFSSSHLSEYANENPYYPGRIDLGATYSNNHLKDYYVKKHGTDFYTPPVKGNRSIDYDAIDKAEDAGDLEQAKIGSLVSSFFKKLDTSKGIK